MCKLVEIKFLENRISIVHLRNEMKKLTENEVGQFRRFKKLKVRIA